MQPEKTQLFCFHNNQLYNYTTSEDNCLLNYLGFSFIGKIVTIRDKTITKYHYRMYRKVKTIVKNDGITTKGNRISCKKLYLKYSEKGAYSGNGNFLTYVKRAEKIFEREPINRGTKRHMQKIRKRLNTIKT